MKNPLLAIIAILTLSVYTKLAYAQTNTFPSNGNVGIGTATPANLLDVYSGGNQILYIKSNSGSGLVTAINNSPADPTTGISNGANFGLNGAPNNFYGLGLGAVRNGAYDIWFQTGAINGGGFRWYTGTAEHMTLDKNGRLSIGTIDAQGYMLAVNGSAIATSMTVKLYANWPDYVFKKDYQLPKLSEVKAYINQNQHLPDMPSEAEVKKDGINLGEMVKLQTKKIEELTLYLIEQNKEKKEQDLKIDQLKQLVETLYKEIRKN